MPIKTNLKTLAPATERLKTQIKLISGGFSVRELLPEGQLTIYPWDSEISDWLVSRTTKAGDDVSLSAEVAAKVTRLNVKQIDKFVASELLLILLVARSLTTEGNVKYTPTCPHCGFVHKPQLIKVPSELGVIGQKPVDYVGYDEITLPKANDVLRIRPLLVEDIRLAREAGGTVSTAALQGVGTNSRHALLSISTVNGEKPDNLGELLTYYRALDPSDIVFLKGKIRENSPSLDTQVPHICDKPECAKDFKFDVSMGYDFFS